MKTLVIHPEDKTTDFLKPIYEGKDWTVINDGKIGKSKLREAIKTHDRIVMLGHGTEYGLISGNITFHRYVIDSGWVNLLRDKHCVAIWCNADQFVKKYDLKGFYTGMIISEIEEAYLYSLYPIKLKDIDASNELFTQSIKEAIDAEDMLSVAKNKYLCEGNPIVEFNKQRLYEKN